MTKFRDWIGGRNRPDGSSGVIVQIAREVVERRRSIQGALNEVRHPAVLDALADDDFRSLDAAVADSAAEYREYAIVLARLTHAAARAKGFDRQIVDAAIRLDSLLPKDDPSRERDQLLRDGYVIAQRAGYVRGGRITLARLGQRAVEADEIEKARGLFQQQLDIGEEATDGPSEIDSAISLGDILRRNGDILGAQALYRRASRSGARIDHYRGVAEALTRQIELMDSGASLETLAALQQQALVAAQRTPDLSLQSRIIIQLAETWARMGRLQDVAPLLEEGVEIARQIGDLAVESRCLNALVETQRLLGHGGEAAVYQEELQNLEERLGNRPAAGAMAIKLGTSQLELGKIDNALDAFEKARALAVSVHDSELEQRALGAIGVAHMRLGEPSEALSHLMQALEIARQTRDYAHEAQWLASIGQALWSFDQPEDAQRVLTEGLAIARRIDDVDLQASMLTMLGKIYAADGQAPRARESYQRALELNKRLGNVREQMALMTSLGNLAASVKQFQQANSMFEGALRIASERNDAAGAARLHGRLGRVAQSQRDQGAALNHYKRSLHFAESTNQDRLILQSLLHLATAQHAIADSSAAATYRRAITVAQQIGDGQREALVRLNLGILLDDSGQREEALSHLYRASDLAVDLGPAGAELSERIEDAIDGAGGSTTTIAPPPARRDAHESFGRRRIVERDQMTPREDQVYHESTLPPQ